MSLSSALSTAQSIFNNTGTQTSVISKNLANAGNANYVKRSAVLGTTMYGANIVTMGRAQDEALLRQTIASSSLFAGQAALSAGLGQIKGILGGNSYESAPSTRIAELLNSLQAYATKPNDAALGSTVVTDAQDVVTSLNTASNEIQNMRTRADKEIKAYVDELNNLLARFEAANNAVKIATSTKTDGSDALDERETLLKQISEIVGVSVVVRDNNDIALYTTDGTTLFETVPRKVTFTPIAGYDALTSGNAVYIDGVAVNAGTGSDSSARGAISGLLQLRDEVIPQFQSQLDEIARGLITLFAEKDPNGVQPDAAGLFTWTGGTMPGGTLMPGLAASIRVNPAVVNNPQLLRDGGINGADYVHNATGGTGYSDLLNSYINSLDGNFAFDAVTGIDANTSLLKYATGSVGWLEQLRSSASASEEIKMASYQRNLEAYTHLTGVSLDEELSLLLDIEQSYKAATKLVNVIDEMMKALLQMAR